MCMHSRRPRRVESSSIGHALCWYGFQERLKREKQEAIEKERLRLQQSKAMLEQQAKLEEETRKRALEQLQREKEVQIYLHLCIMYKYVDQRTPQTYLGCVCIATVHLQKIETELTTSPCTSALCTVEITFTVSGNLGVRLC